LTLGWCSALADSPTAQQLYDRFKVARLALVEQGPPGALDLYTRQFIADSPDFTGIGIVSAVYSYRLVASEDGALALEMQLTTNLCGKAGADRPALDTYSFVNEDGTWRVARIRMSSLPKDLKWYRADLSPIDRFPYFSPADHMVAWNELFARLGSSKRVSNPCAKESR